MSATVDARLGAQILHRIKRQADPTHLEAGDPFRRLHRTGPAQRPVKADAVGQIGAARRDKAKSLPHRLFPSPPLPPAPCTWGPPLPAARFRAALPCLPPRRSTLPAPADRTHGVKG